MNWTDTHCHINEPQFQEDRQLVKERARSSGVKTFIEIAESPATWEAAIQLAESDADIYTSLGIHPHHAHEVSKKDWPEVRKKLRDLLQHPKVKAVGEFGLDYYRMQNTKENQEWICRAQIELALELQKPIVIHCREAHEDTQKILADYFSGKNDQISGVIHCFSGTFADAQIYMPMGFVFGVDGPITYPSANALREAFAQIPLNCIVLETDSPFLPPQSYRGKRNEPQHIPIMGEALAKLKGCSIEEAAHATTDTAKKLFRLA